ncbi:MAG: hypothetical protein E6Q50_17330 [Lysobacter sp.]|jgi:hypothetical protein|nr:MAG: hypothetical protein E6Q50_17330 [Lysobacter sp.]
MDYSEFVAVIGEKKEPEMKDFGRVAVFAQSADKELLWTALGSSGVHPIYRTLIIQALHQRIIEELEREQQARKRKLEEEARLEALKEERALDAPRRRLR